MIRPRDNGAVGGIVTVCMDDAAERELAIECDVTLYGPHRAPDVEIKRWHLDDGTQPPAWEPAETCPVSEHDRELRDRAEEAVYLACDHEPQDVIDSSREDAAYLRGDR